VKTVVIDVRSLDQVIAESKAKLRSRNPDKNAYMHFANPGLLLKLLTEKRWALLKAISGKWPVTFRKAADLVGRDVKGVHADLTALIKAGIVDRAGGGPVFPYETIKVRRMKPTSLNDLKEEMRAVARGERIASPLSAAAEKSSAVHFGKHRGPKAKQSRSRSRRFTK
jgi:predicted transcriptional regulator